jgi:ferredoxin
MNNYSYD